MLAAASVCVLPCGAMEQHGPHLPLGTDTMVAERVTARLIEACGPEAQMVRLPALAYGISPEHLAFAGTISLTREAFCETVCSIAASLARHGVRRMVLLNAHGGNSDALGSILREIREDYGIKAVLLDIYRSRTLGSAAEGQDWHAGRVETSLYLALRGEGSVSPAEGLPAHRFDAKPWSLCDIMSVPWRSDEISATGIIGDPSAASAECGARLVTELVDEMVEALRSLGSWGEGEWL